MIFNEDKFEVKKLNSVKEIEKAYELRYQVFSEELKWFPENNSQKDIDKYDQYSIHFGIFSHLEKLEEKELVGYCCIIPPNNNFMLEEEFKDLLSEDYLLHKKQNAVEISRLVIKKTFRLNQGFQIRMLLYKSMYQWSIKNDVRYWYMVVDTRYLRSLQKLFPCRQIGKIKFYQPNLPTVAALLDLREAEQFVSRKNWELYKWFTSEESKEKRILVSISK